VTSWNGAQAPYLGLDISFDHGATIGDKLFFEPVYQTPSSGNPLLPNQGSPVLNQWQTWNALVGGWWSDNSYGNATPGTGVKSLTAILAAYTLAGDTSVTISNDPSNGLGGVRLTSGFASAGDVFNTNVDNFTIGTGAKSTTYDFEPALATPEPSTLASAFSGALALLGFAWVRRRKATA
jgi:hypothetical protein